MIEMYRTLKKDLPLFTELELTPFRANHGERLFVGQVKLDGDSYVKIWVTAAPAQFWHFEVYCAEGDRVHKVSTGSGSLSDYWPSVRLLAEGLLVVDASYERVN